MFLDLNAVRPFSMSLAVSKKLDKEAEVMPGVFIVVFLFPC